MQGYSSLNWYYSIGVESSGGWGDKGNLTEEGNRSIILPLLMKFSSLHRG